MELRWLQDFLSLVDTRNFSRSAELRFTTQPAFSRRIKSLEEWIGTALFDRSAQPIALTFAGEQFRPVAEEVLRRLYQVREDIRYADKAEASTISFAATHSLSLTFFAGWIRSIEKSCGVLMTRLDSNHFEDCVQSLLKGRCHFMLCHTHPSVEVGLPANHFMSIKVGEDILLPVTIPDSSGRPIDELPGSREHPVHYLAYAETSAIGRAVDNMLKQREVPAHLERVFVSHLAAVLKTMSCEGRGLSWLPRSQVVQELQDRSLAVAGDETWTIPIEIRLFRSREPLPSKSEEFWSLCAAAGA